MSQRRGSRVHELWARFRFSVIGQLLAAPPAKGTLRGELDKLAARECCHPISGEMVRFGVSTLERWYQAVLAQYAAHKSWSAKLHHDNLVALAEKQPGLGPVPSYSTLHRFLKAHGLYKRRPLTSRRTEGAERAEARLSDREVRSYEAEYTGGLWRMRSSALCGVVGRRARVCGTPAWILSA